MCHCMQCLPLQASLTVLKPLLLWASILVESELLYSLAEDCMEVSLIVCLQITCLPLVGLLVIVYVPCIVCNYHACCVVLSRHLTLLTPAKSSETYFRQFLLVHHQSSSSVSSKIFPLFQRCTYIQRKHNWLLACFFCDFLTSSTGTTGMTNRWCKHHYNVQCCEELFDGFSRLLLLVKVQVVFRPLSVVLVCQDRSAGR